MCVSGPAVVQTPSRNECWWADKALRLGNILEIRLRLVQSLEGWRHVGNSWWFPRHNVDLSPPSRHSLLPWDAPQRHLNLFSTSVTYCWRSACLYMLINIAITLEWVQLLVLVLCGESQAWIIRCWDETLFVSWTFKCVNNINVWTQQLNEHTRDHAFKPTCIKTWTVWAVKHMLGTSNVKPYDWWCIKSSCCDPLWCSSLWWKVCPHVLPCYIIRIIIN